MYPSISRTSIVNENETFVYRRRSIADSIMLNQLELACVSLVYHTALYLVWKELERRAYLGVRIHLAQTSCAKARMLITATSLRSTLVPRVICWNPLSLNISNSYGSSHPPSGLQRRINK